MLLWRCVASSPKHSDFSGLALGAIVSGLQGRFDLLGIERILTPFGVPAMMSIPLVPVASRSFISL